MFKYLARIIYVMDGDTLKLDIDLGFRVHILETVRLARINAPDTVNFGAQGINDPAKNYILDKCPIGSMCLAQITRPDKYGRWLAEIFFQPGENDPVKILQNPRVLNDELVRNGFAKLYSGGKK